MNYTPTGVRQDDDDDNNDDDNDDDNDDARAMAVLSATLSAHRDNFFFETKQKSFYINL